LGLRLDCLDGGFRLGVFDFLFLDVVGKPGPGGNGRAVETEVPAHGRSHIVVERTRVSLLFGDPEFGKEIEYPAWLDFKLASQLVNPDLTHRQDAIFPR
jgi:hypothetical protein